MPEGKIMKQIFQVIMSLVILLTHQPVPMPETDGYQMIPDEAIRLRILAESDDPEDQQLKYAVRDAVNAEITTWVEQLTSIEDAREIIKSRLDQIDKIVANTLKDHGSTINYTIDYDSNVLFPAKLYDQYVYPAGEYEAILITLGEGEGSNWWCVLFPPLCFLDFSAGTTVSMDEEEQAAEQEESDLTDKPKISFFFLEWFR